MAIDLAVDYAPYVDELFTQESKKDLLTNQDLPGQVHIRLRYIRSQPPK